MNDRIHAQTIFQLKDGNYAKRIRLDPKDVNLDTARLETLAMATREQSIRVTLRCIYGSSRERSPCGIVELNAINTLVVAK